MKKSDVPIYAATIHIEEATLTFDNLSRSVPLPVDIELTFIGKTKPARSVVIRAARERIIEVTPARSYDFKTDPHNFSYIIVKVTEPIYEKEDRYDTN